MEMKDKENAVSPMSVTQPLIHCGETSMSYIRSYSACNWHNNKFAPFAFSRDVTADGSQIYIFCIKVRHSLCLYIGLELFSQKIAFPTDSSSAYKLLQVLTIFTQAQRSNLSIGMNMTHFPKGPHCHQSSITIRFMTQHQYRD